MVRRVLLWLLVALAVYAVAAAPVATGNAVRVTGEGLRAAAQAVVDASERWL